MIESRLPGALRELATRLDSAGLNWAVGGSLSLALRGAPIQPRDIDIVTDMAGSYEIERIFSRFVTKRVSLRTSENIRSHFGVLDLDGVKIDIMGDFQLLGADGEWGEPPNLRSMIETVRVEDLQIPVPSLEWEHMAYSRLGRQDKVDIIDRLLKDKRIR